MSVYVSIQLLLSMVSTVTVITCVTIINFTVCVNVTCVTVKPSLSVVSILIRHVSVICCVCVTDSLSVSMSLVDCHSYPQHSLSPSTVIITICITWCLSLSLSMAVSLAVSVSLSDDMSVSVVDSWGCHTWNK